MATHKSGFVNIVGNPNVGKSTLMNALVGERISIITSKAQTTRHRITGIVNGEDYQIVFSDTPGVLKPNYKLQESMNESALTATKRPIRGGWGFGGDYSGPIEAAALAYWGASTSKRDPERKMRIG